jgi:hypothetical protein
MRLKSLLLFSVVAAVTILPARAVPPAAPTAVRAYAPNQNRVHVSWVDNATDETGYKVERRVDSGAWENLTPTLLPADFEVFRWTAVSSAEQTYKFRITAVKGAEESTETESQALVKPSGALDLFNDITRTEPGSQTGEPFEIPEPITVIRDKPRENTLVGSILKMFIGTTILAYPMRENC